MSRLVLGPFNRVEGDLEVQLTVNAERVTDAWVVSPLYRGFEEILRGKDPMDALVYAPRICGICSVSQSVASARAIAMAQDLILPSNGELAGNLILATENLADHLTHFYLFFMPDFARAVYRKEAWFTAAERRFKSASGSATAEILPKRAELLHIMGLLAGKWPHSLALQPGGTTRAVETQERNRILAILFSFRRFLEKTVFGDQLEAVIALDSATALDDWALASPPEGSDFRHFLCIAEALQLQRLGRSTDRFLSYGAYPTHSGPFFRSGVWDKGISRRLDPVAISEDVSHAWMQPQNQALHPYDGLTLPAANQPEGYTWCKAPRLAGEVVEVGALARQLNDAHPLIQDLVLRDGGNVRNRVIARLLELARVTVAMEQWTRDLKPREPFCVSSPLPEEGEGYGLIEAARGSLGHWLRFRKGRIANYQIIAPTTWNFSPRDQIGTPGTLEQALRGAPIRTGETDPVSVQHIVRSFDPCMVCTVH